jgi:cobalamin biosynthesis protein CobW
MRLTAPLVRGVDTYFDRPFGTAARVTRLVVIGRAGLKQAEIDAALRT